jgi:hypothetical protein
MKVGTKWGCLEVIQTESIPVTAKTATGELYHTGEYTVKINLICDCGREVSVLERELDKRRVRSCKDLGYADCTAERRFGRPKKQMPGVIVSAYISLALFGSMKEWAREHNVSFSKAQRIAMERLVKGD